MPDQPDQSRFFSSVARATLRREKIAARLALPTEVHRTASTRVLAHLAALLTPRPPGIIAFCWPIRAEVDCRPLIAELLGAGWHAAMPVVVTPAAPMQFRAWTTTTPMAVDPHGIPVPATQNPQNVNMSLLPDVLLLPLVAVDAAGYRLGYGGGYFDRTLAACTPRPLAVGVGFELAAVADIYPHGHDIPLDVSVTEAGIKRFTP